MNRLNVTFIRSDRKPQFIIDAVKDVANHFSTGRTYVADFCSLIATSWNWNMEVLATKLEQWKNRFSRISGTNSLISIIEKSFSSCEDDEQIHDLRGALLEALVIASYGGTDKLNDPAYGWGAKVYLNDTAINYQCPLIDLPKCDNRYTVDFGFWNGHHGRFYECKVNPGKFSCKEHKYLEKLHLMMDVQNVSHEIYFVSAYSEYEVNKRLEPFSPSFKIIPIGTQKIRESLSGKVHFLGA